MKNKILNTIKRNWSYLAGMAIGALGGYLYWYFIGCSDGTCAITSSPVNSSIWGAVMGALLFNLIFGQKKK